MAMCDSFSGKAYCFAFIWFLFSSVCVLGQGIGSSSLSPDNLAYIKKYISQNGFNSSTISELTNVLGISESQLIEGG